MYILTSNLGQYSTSFDLSRAIDRNVHHREALGWGAYISQISQLLKIEPFTPKQETFPQAVAFAQAVADWQKQQRGLDVDGILGSKSWQVMKSALKISTSPKESKGKSTPASDDKGMQTDLGTLTITKPDKLKFSYSFTPEDLLWTARFILGEAGGKNNLENQAVIWAMFNRYAFFTHKKYRTFHGFIRAYSTPLQATLINWKAARRHMKNPNFVPTGEYYPHPHEDIPKGQLKRHLDLQKMAWDKLPLEARQLAEKAMKGLISNPIGTASEFASTRIYFKDHYNRFPTNEEWRKFTADFPARNKKDWIWLGEVPGLNQKGNAFFVDKRVAGLPKDTVSIVSSFITRSPDKKGDVESPGGDRIQDKSDSQKEDVKEVDRFDKKDFIPPICHLKTNSRISRYSDHGRAYPLNESGQPIRSALDASQKRNQLTDIVNWLQVESSIRYQAKVKDTYCNIYAYDYCYLGQVYLPRVWWTQASLRKLNSGQAVSIEYGKTVSELGANNLTDWLENFGSKYGWFRSNDLTQLQNAANQGQVCIISAKRKLEQGSTKRGSGHIVVVVPETAIYKATRDSNRVTIPLQSQAGRNNFRYRYGAKNRVWWTDRRFEKYGFWIHP